MLKLYSSRRVVKDNQALIVKGINYTCYQWIDKKEIGMLRYLRKVDMDILQEAWLSMD